MIARLAFGCRLDVQSAVGALVILTTISIYMPYYNTKRLKIDQHRAWMLRAMFFLGTIITTRIIMIISAKIITLIGDCYQVQTCTEIAFDYGGSQSKAVSLYPQCANSGPNTDVILQCGYRKNWCRPGPEFRYGDLVIPSDAPCWCGDIS
jgi:hypothetical protein